MQYQLEIDSILFHIPKSLCNSRGETEFSGIARWAEMGKQEERPFLYKILYSVRLLVFCIVIILGESRTTPYEIRSHAITFRSLRIFTFLHHWIRPAMRYTW